VQNQHCVLIIDDDIDLRFLLAQVLAQSGFSVLEAGNGKEAMDLLEKSSLQPSLLLIDLDMPVMNGVEFIQFLLNDPVASEGWGKIPRVIYSARVDLYSEMLPADDARLNKPVHTYELIQTILQILEPGQ
jgi:CheY-like chemotaxis protein